MEPTSETTRSGSGAVADPAQSHGSLPNADRIAGALMGVAAGDALGATVEFKSAIKIAALFPEGHREIIGGGPFGWRPGEGTDDTDLTVALARTYIRGYSLERAADAFLAWYRRRPKDVGSTTASGLSLYAKTDDARTSGDSADQARANGSLMRCIATGLVRTDPAVRRAEAAEISAITHASAVCMDSCVAYCDIAAALIDGTGAHEAVDVAASNPELHPEVRDVLRRAAHDPAMPLDPTGYVLGSLGCAVHALTTARTFEDALVADVALGSDADTHGAIAGGLLGAQFGLAAIPDRWVEKLEYGLEIMELSGALAALRSTEAAS